MCSQLAVECDNVLGGNIAAGTIITMLAKTKSLLYNIPKGLKELKLAFS